MPETMFDLQPHLARLRRYACFLTHDKTCADDLVQDTIVRALEKADLFRHDTNLRGWLMTIMHNEHVNATRRSVRAPILAAEETLARIGREETQTASVEVRELRRGVGRLPREQQEILMLHWVHGFRYSEISRRLGLPLGTVQSRLSRARKKLTSMIEMPHSGLGLAHCNAARVDRRHAPRGDGIDLHAAGVPHHYPAPSAHHGPGFAGPARESASLR